MTELSAEGAESNICIYYKKESTPTLKGIFRRVGWNQKLPSNCSNDGKNLSEKTSVSFSNSTIKDKIYLIVLLET